MLSNFSQIRYLQQARQLQQQQKYSTGNLSSYSERDPVTGNRIVNTADGGVDRTNYISNSVVTTKQVMPLYQSGDIGLTGYISQKPSS